MKCKKCKAKFVFPVCPECGKEKASYPFLMLFYFLPLGIILGMGVMDGVMGTKIEKKSIESYKQGQIDALNGDWHYDKIIQEKTDTIYIKIK